MKLNPPKKYTFWTAVIVAAVGFIGFILDLAGALSLAWLAPVAFLLVVVAFVLLCLGLTVKGF